MLRATKHLAQIVGRACVGQSNPAGTDQLSQQVTLGKLFPIYRRMHVVRLCTCAHTDNTHARPPALLPYSLRTIVTLLWQILNVIVEFEISAQEVPMALQ